MGVELWRGKRLERLCKNIVYIVLFIVDTNIVVLKLSHKTHVLKTWTLVLRSRALGRQLDHKGTDLINR